MSRCIDADALLKAIIQMSLDGNVFDRIHEAPTIEPELPEWAQKVEEYRKSAPSHINNPLAWALYQTWKEYDG